MDWNSEYIADLLRRALEEDVGAGDATTLATIPTQAAGRARVIARAPLICAGLPLIECVFEILDPEMDFEFLAKDGDSVEASRELVRMRGSAQAILTGERTALNFLAHLSGIATLTRRFVEQLKGTKAKVRDTRKTTPGLRMIEKYAVRMGGGTNHRFGLFDAILLKENHIALAGGVKAALDKGHAYASTQVVQREISAYEAAGSPARAKGDASLPVQIEVKDESELRDALKSGAESVLLDNMTPERARSCVELARSLRSDCVIEISGGITLENARAYAETGADFLSVGALTHSAPAADLSLLVDSIEDT
ncbi:MAG: carboxylating nicotinate-nucleotide diphosphorylase [Candidatus Acidiferrales bacterium]